MSEFGDLRSAELVGSAKPLLLIVDDQPINIQALYELFKDECTVCMSTNGADAIAFCLNRQPDLVLLDVIMPDMSGYQVAQQLKHNIITQNIPIIFVTAQNDPAEEAQGFDNGGVDFITKPFHANVVKARVNTHLTIKYQADLLRALSQTDGLTGVANRRHFDVTLQAEWRRCGLANQNLALILLDVDYFKRYNDHYGHQAGDRCLQTIAAVLKSSFSRSHDLVARYGGEEFVCVLPDTLLAGAEQKAQQLENAVRELRIAHEGSETTDVVTISLGVAAVIPDKNNFPADLIAAADQQLYLAKQAGRGQVKSG